MTVVFDTRIIVAALLANGICHECFRRAIREHMLASSPVLLDEIETALRPRFLITASVKKFLSSLRSQIRLVAPTLLPSRPCRDERRDCVLATAAGAEADAIVSADPDLLAIGEHGRIRLVSPRRFLQWLDGRAEL